MTELLHLPQHLLHIHPRNMRRIYPAADVEQMAESIRQRGVLQPLLAVPIAPDDPVGWDGYYVVAGNLRLAGLRRLGPDAPLVPVMIRALSETDQLLAMSVENAVRFDPDPISEAQHYARILLQPGMNERRLHEVTGISTTRIRNRLAWLDLEEPIQAWAAAGKLPTGAAEHLRRIPPGPARLGAARSFVQGGTKLKHIRAACSRIANSLQRNAEEQKAAADPAGPALSLVGRDRPPGDPAVPTRVVQSALAAACSACPVMESAGNAPPLSWAIWAHGAERSCDECSLREFASMCRDCPLVIALQHIARAVRRAAPSPPAPTAQRRPSTAAEGGEFADVYIARMKGVRS